jgi:hypothetical protein
MKAKALSLALLVTVLLSACGAMAAQQPVEVQPGYLSGAEGGVALPEMDAARSAEEPSFASAPQAVQPERLVIQTANLSVVVEDPSRSLDDIRRMAEEMGGFVVTSNLYQTAYGDPAVVTHSGSITIRVPSGRFDDALDRVKETSIEVRSENVSGEDVTQQYTDLQSRLTNLESAEGQLREIMESAVRTEDVLRVFEDLRRVREEIEVIKGQIQYFEESARLSAISIELIPDAASQPIQIGGWRPEGTVKIAFESLIRALQGLVDAAIWVGICGLPAAILIGVPAWAAVRIVRRRRAASLAPAPAPKK